MYIYAIIKVEGENAMNMEKTRLSIDIPKIEHKRLKALAALRGTSVKEIVLNCIHETLYKDPNELTKKVLKETREGKNLNYYDSVDDMIEKLGLNE